MAARETDPHLIDGRLIFRGSFLKICSLYHWQRFVEPRPDVHDYTWSAIGTAPVNTPVAAIILRTWFHGRVTRDEFASFADRDSMVLQLRRAGWRLHSPGVDHYSYSTREGDSIC